MRFGFGSNELGIHGGGAARVAREKHGAVLHQGFGPQGNSFAIPTCSKPTGEKDHEIAFAKLKFYVDCYILFAHQNPDEIQQVTQIGCGLAGWTKEQIAPLFLHAPENMQFDTAWQPILGDTIPQPVFAAVPVQRKYWGHVG